MNLNKMQEIQKESSDVFTFPIYLLNKHFAMPKNETRLEVGFISSILFEFIRIKLIFQVFKEIMLVWKNYMVSNGMDSDQ